MLTVYASLKKQNNEQLDVLYNKENKHLNLSNTEDKINMKMTIKANGTGA